MYEMRNSILQYLTPFYAVLLGLSIVWSMVGFLPPPPSSVRIVLFLIATLAYVLRGGRTRKLPILFLVYLIINIIMCEPDSYYRIWERFLLFALVFTSVGPCIRSYDSALSRRNALYILLFIVTILSIGSFFCFFWGINLMRRENVDTSEYLTQVGWFSGLFNHSMQLGPMSAISSSFILYIFFKTRKKILLALMIPSIGAVMFSASRSAFVALILSLIFMYYHFANNKKTFFRYISGAVIILILSFPLWGSGLARMAVKQEANTELGQFGSRTNQWEYRIGEFMESPVIGIGFSTVSVQSGNVDRMTGGVEPGSSWLAIASMTGILGLFFVLSMFFHSYKNIRNNKTDYTAFLLSLLVFFSVHMLSEGYIYAGGNSIAVLAWLVIGCCYDLKEYKIQ